MAGDGMNQDDVIEGGWLSALRVNPSALRRGVTRGAELFRPA